MSGASPSGPLVAVTSPSFCAHPELAQETERSFPGCRLNRSGQRLEGDVLVEFLAGAAGAVVGLETMDEAVLQRCPDLRIIAKYGVGLDNIDLDWCARSGIAIGWTGGVNRLSVAEMTLGFMLALCRNLFVTSTLLKSGEWRKQGGIQLSGRTVGVIGVGNIGREVVRLLQPFHCTVLVNDIIDLSEYCREHGVTSASKEEIFAAADIVTIHTPLNNETRDLVDRATLSRMKRGAYLINTARGGVVNQVDLAWALSSGVIAGAAVDVYDVEPPKADEFLTLPNLICTPHIGGNSSEAVSAMGFSAINHLKEYFGR